MRKLIKLHILKYITISITIFKKLVDIVIAHKQLSSIFSVTNKFF
jgi:hypothetical protein